MIGLNLPSGISGNYDLTDIEWPLEETKVGNSFYFYPERFTPDGNCPDLKEEIYRITQVGFNENDGYYLILSRLAE